MQIIIILIIIAVISIGLAVRSLFQLKKKLGEVERTSELLAKNRTIFHAGHDSSSETTGTS